ARHLRSATRWLGSWDLTCRKIERSQTCFGRRGSRGGIRRDRVRQLQRYTSMDQIVNTTATPSVMASTAPWNHCQASQYTPDHPCSYAAVWSAYQKMMEPMLMFCVTALCFPTLIAGTTTPRRAANIRLAVIRSSRPKITTTTQSGNTPQ